MLVLDEAEDRVLIQVDHDRAGEGGYARTCGHRINIKKPPAPCSEIWIVEGMLVRRFHDFPARLDGKRKQIVSRGKRHGHGKVALFVHAPGRYSNSVQQDLVAGFGEAGNDKGREVGLGHFGQRQEIYDGRLRDRLSPVVGDGFAVKDTLHSGLQSDHTCPRAPNMPPADPRA